MSITLPVAVSAKDWQEGAADAPVTLVEYGDFQCGDCREAYYVLKALREQQAGNLRFVYRHLPLTDIHPHALDAAKASEIVGEAGKFWEMHDALYTSAAGLGREELAQAAAQVGLNAPDFAAHLSDEQTYAAVRADVDGIRPTGIHHTPTLFLNGEQYTGPSACPP